MTRMFLLSRLVTFWSPLCHSPCSQSCPTNSSSSQSVHLPPHYCGPGSSLHPFSSATNSECSLIICQGKHPKMGTKSFSCLNTSVGVSSCTIFKKNPTSQLLFHAFQLVAAVISHPFEATDTRRLAPYWGPQFTFSFVSLLWKCCSSFKVNSNPTSSMNPHQYRTTSFGPRVTWILIVALLGDVT